MNTANLQLEGLYVTLAALFTALRDKGVLSGEEIAAALGAAEEGILNDRQRDRPAHADAVLFPLRYLREALERREGDPPPSFTAIAATVGETKPPRA